MITKQIAGSFIGTLAAGAVIIGVAKLMGPIPLSISQTTTNKQSTFDVSGEGNVTTDPDRANVSLGIQVNDDTVTKTQDHGNQIIKKITDDVLKLGIDKTDIKTTNYSLYPNYTFQAGNQKITGYALNITIQVTVKDFSKINQVVDSATGNGANQVGGVSFTLSDSKKLDVENQARGEAINAAKQKADSLSRLSGVRLGKIVNVIETNNQIPRPIPYMMTKDVALGAPTAIGAGAVQISPPTDVQPGSTTFTMTVTLSYETL